jgi:two-component SAPR family response regulator
MQGLQIATLGRAEVRLWDQPVQWHSESAKQLFFYLLSNHAGQTLDAILENLWGLEVNAATSNRFRVNIHRVRAALGARDTVLEDHGHYRLSPEVLAVSDIHAFYSQLERAEHASSLEARLEAFQQALALYQGHFLAHYFEQSNWVNQTRTELQAAYTRAEIETSLLYCELSRCQASVSALSRALNADPLIGENHHQKLMTCLSVVENPEAATEHYVRFQKFLRQTLNDAPMPETLDLAERIQLGEHICQRDAHMPNMPATHNCPFVPEANLQDSDMLLLTVYP